MLDEALHHIFVKRILARQLGGDLHHVLTEDAHPGSAVGLLEIAPRRQWARAVEDADVVETEETPLEQVPPGAILAVDPPAKVKEELAELVSQPAPVAIPAS